MANIRTVEHEFLQTRLLLDIVMTGTGMLCAYFTRFYLLDATRILPATGYDSLLYVRLFCYAWPLTIISFVWIGLYGLRDPVFNYDIFKRIVRGALLALALVLAVHFVFRIEARLFSRVLFFAAPVSVVLFVTVGRLLLRRQIRRLKTLKQIGVVNVLIVGVGELARILVHKVAEHPESGLELKGFVAAQPERTGETIEGLNVLGVTKDIRELIRQHKVRQVILAQPDMSTAEMFELMLECEKEMAESRFVPNLLEMRLTDYSFENLSGLPLFGLKSTPLHGLNLVVKTMFDKAVASVGLIVSLPLQLLLGLWVYLDSGRPILYKQRRLGLDGREFNMYKFRSMNVDAESNGETWTAADDPRRTRAGRFMRRWNLDELPQLINVWRGDMSLVGPRPERPEWVEKFKEEIPHYMKRHTVKSGITGWAQVHGLRGDTDLERRQEFDLYYIENWTLWLDIKILLMTLKAWKNAY